MKTISHTLDSFTRAYIACALWASTDNANEHGGEPLDANYSEDDLSEEALAGITQDCEAFQSDNAANLALMEEAGFYKDAQGHDFFLTRCGHGAGYWDRGLGKLGRELSDAAKVYGNQDIYVGDDGKLHIS